MKYIFLLALVLPFNSFACLSTNNLEIEIDGKIIPSVYKTEELVAHYKSIELIESQCFAPDNELSDKEVYIKTIQLSVPQEIKIEVGSTYLLTGIAFHAHTAHHYTDIVFSVMSAKKLN